MNVVLPFRTGREPPKAERSAMETRIYTANEIGAWRIPPFQRPLRVNAKVRALAEQIRENDGCVPGVIVLGTVRTESAAYVYIVDGQHRIEAFRISGLPELLADFRFMVFDTMADMAEEFVQTNSALVQMRPDDILRGLEPSLRALRKIREECKFVGYDQIRRGSSSSPIVGMSLLIRCWNAASGEIPASGGGGSAVQIAQSLTDDSAEDLIQFMITAHGAWGRDNEYARLWGSLNLTLCMWLWKRLVKDRDRSGTRRYVALNIKQFSRCLMALSADGKYLDWLQGRHLSDRDRGPAYTRMKSLWAARLKEEIGRKIAFPQPAWASR